jgi:hypothetical protein
LSRPATKTERIKSQRNAVEQTFAEGFEFRPNVLLGKEDLLLCIKQLHRIDLKLQHIRRLAAVVSAFALHGDAAEF